LAAVSPSLLAVEDAEKPKGKKREIKKGIMYATVGVKGSVMDKFKAIKEAGLKIPQKISIVGYGDPQWSELLTPALTTVRLPADDLANKAANELLRRLRGEEIDSLKRLQTYRVKTQLVVRGSTAPPSQ
jgi:hypothetical protein